MDGLRDDVQYFRDLYNVERVEALKGPNAMIFGRGGAGGVVNRATRQADWSRTREATLQAGSFGNRRATFDAGNRLGNTAAARATAVYENSDSYRDGVSLERYGVNPTVAFVPGAGTVLRAGYEYFHDERTADRGVPSLGDRPFPTAASAFFGDSSQSTARATVHAVSLGVDHRVGASVGLRNRTRIASYDKFYQNVYAGGAVSDDGSAVPLAAYNNATGRTNLFNQTDLTIQSRTGPVRHTIVAGAEFGRQETDNFRNTGYFASGATSLVVPSHEADVRVPVSVPPERDRRGQPRRRIRRGRVRAGPGRALLSPGRHRRRPLRRFPCGFHQRPDWRAVHERRSSRLAPGPAWCSSLRSPCRCMRATRSRTSLAQANSSGL